MATKRGEGYFGAFVEPNGIYLIEYRRERDGISILRQHTDDRRVIGLAEAGERLGALVQSLGSQGGHLSAAVRGFGSTYQIMMLPPAEPAVLSAVVKRELTRLNPEMESPRVDYVLGGEVDRRRRNRPEGGQPQQEVLVGAAPELALAAFGEELATAGIGLDHLTLLPQVIQRLYQKADASPQPTACFIELAGGPLIGFFNEGQLRLVVEPPTVDEMDLTGRVQTLIEHLERGNLYLRQQFRGVELSRLLVATNPDDETEFIDALRERVGYPVDKFPGPVATPGALMAMGAVLDGEAEKGLNLSPFAESPEAKGARQQRRTAILAGAAVCALAVIWAVFTLASDLRLAKKVESERAVAEARMNTLAPLRVVASQRQKNAQSLTYLNTLSADREHTQAILRGLIRATPPGVQLNTVSLNRTGGEWTMQMTGSAFGDTGADVLLGIDRLFHNLPREVPMHDLVLAELDDVAPGGFGAGMRFTLTFTATAEAPKP